MARTPACSIEDYRNLLLNALKQRGTMNTYELAAVLNHTQTPRSVGRLMQFLVKDGDVQRYRRWNLSINTTITHWTLLGDVVRESRPARPTEHAPSIRTPAQEALDADNDAWFDRLHDQFQTYKERKHTMRGRV